MGIASWLAFRSTWSDDSSLCWTHLPCWPITCGDPTTSPTRWPASIGCASPERIELKIAVLIYKVVHGLAPVYLSPFTRRVADLSSRDHCFLSAPIAWSCLTADCGLLVAELFPWPARRPGKTSRKTWWIIRYILSPPQDTPVQKVFSWLLAGHQLTVCDGPSSSSAT